MLPQQSKNSQPLSYEGEPIRQLDLGLESPRGTVWIAALMAGMAVAVFVGVALAFR